MSYGPSIRTVKPGKKSPLTDENATIYTGCIADCFCADSLRLNHVSEDVFFIDNVLTDLECERLRNAIDESGDLSFWNCSDSPEELIELRQFRNANTIEINSSVFAGKIWKRVSPLLTFLNVVVDDSDHSCKNWERELVGLWQASSLNEDLLFAKYPSLGSFAPHTDGRAIYDFNRRSFFSVIIFLNGIDAISGGGTKFYDSAAIFQLEKRVIDGSECWSANDVLSRHSIDAVAGRMLIFHQSMVHEGLPPRNPFEKYIIRSDIMFSRDPPVCDTEQDRTAFRLFQEAEALAESGNIDESVVLFKKAFKMSPLMSSMMGQS